MSRRRLLCQTLARISSPLVFAVTVSLTAAHAETTPRQADQELNTSYKAAMQELSPGAREKLRIAQRAWLAFVEKNSAAMRKTAPALGISAARCQEIEVDEVEQRTKDFDYSKESNEPEEIKGSYERVDAGLNHVYERCLTTLSPEAKAALREAQRAWITYRDANRPFGIEFVSGLTVRRSDQLTDFYVALTTKPVTVKPPEKAQPSPPDPFARAR